MKSFLKSGLVALALLGTAHSGALAQSVSPAVGSAIKKSVSLANSGNTAGALAQVDAARAAATTAAEKQKVGEAAAYVYTKAGRWSDAARALEGVGAGPRQLAPYYYRAGDYDKAISLAKKAGGAEMDVIVAQSLSKQGKTAEAAETYKKLIKQNGPRTDWLENLYALQYKSGDRAGSLETVRALIKADPSPARWNTLLAKLKGQNMGDGPKFGLYQLMRETGNLTQPQDVQDLAKFAVLANVPGAAVSALNDATKANVLSPSDPMTQRLMQTASARAKQQPGTRQPNTPAGQLELGNTLFGAANYPGALGAYQKAIAGNAPGADQARLLGAISSIRSGNAGGAASLLSGVTPNGGFKDIAELWALYAQTKR